jgi:microcystin-dependent protein
MTTKVTPSVLADTTVVTGTYGGTTQLAVVTVDAQGRITFAANATPSIATTQLTGTISNAQLAGSITTNKITGLAASATTDATVASNITSGTLPAARLPASGVSAGTVGGTTQHSVVTVDATGRVTNIANATPSIATSQLTGTLNYNQLSADVTTTLAPTGVVHMWPNNTAPTGYLLCNGQAVSRTTFNALYVLIGTTFGLGDGSTTFNLPNFLNRFPMGAGTGGTYAIGATGGSADAIVVSHTHTFSGTTAEGGAHTHTITDPGHSHTYFRPVQSNAANPPGSSGSQASSTTTSAAFTNITINATGTHTHTYSGTTTSAGSSGTNANLPPYLGINFIIKT